MNKNEISNTPYTILTTNIDHLLGELINKTIKYTALHKDDNLEDLKKNVLIIFDETRLKISEVSHYTKEDHHDVAFMLKMERNVEEWAKKHPKDAKRIKEAAKHYH